jgi:hypothetical protein
MGRRRRTTSPQGIAVDVTNVYWSTLSSAGGVVAKVPLAGGVPTILASGQAGVYAVSIDSSNVYWTAWSMSGAVMKVALGGGAPITLAASQSFPEAIAVDDANVYWTVFIQPAYAGLESGAVMRVGTSGGAPVTMASGPSAPQAVVVDEASNGSFRGPLPRLPFGASASSEVEQEEI